MAALVWDKTAEHFYETGVDHGVLYPFNGAAGTYGAGVAWNGLINVNETPSGGEANPQYADNIKYLNIYSKEELGLTIEAFTFPDEFLPCDGAEELVDGVTVHQQSRKMFGFSYRSLIGNDTEGTDLGYKLHIVYGCTASPSERAYATINESPEAIHFSWSISTVPVEVAGKKPTAVVTIDSTKISEANLKKIEDKLYGTNGNPTILLPDEIVALVGSGN